MIRSSQITEEGVLRGKVVDAQTGAVLAGALIEIPELRRSTSTNDAGEFRFVGLPPGSYSAIATYLGYRDLIQAVDIEPRRGAELLYAMVGGTEQEPIVVYGSRSSRAISLNQERTAENSSTVISADLLGNFTGTTISDALRRAPGVSFQADPNTGDGTNIIIRGLEPDYNQIKLNGLPLPEGTGQGRSANLSNILADSIASITINKTLLPNNDSAGTGGLVEIETKSPLDRPRRFASFAAETVLRGEGFGKDRLLSGTVSGIFGSQANFGLSASAQYREQDVTSVQYSLGGAPAAYYPLGPDGNPIDYLVYVDPRTPFPFEEGMDDYYIDTASNSIVSTKSDTLTLSAGAALELSDHTKLRLDVVRSDRKTDTYTESLSVYAIPLTFLRPVPELGGEERYVISSDWRPPTVNQTYLWTPEARELTDSISFRGESKFGRWEADYSLGYARGRTTTPEGFNFVMESNGALLTDFTDRFLLPEAYVAGLAGIPSYWAPRTGSDYPLPLFNEDGWSIINDEATYNFLTYQNYGERRGSNDILNGRLDLLYRFESPILKYLQVGAEWKDARFDTEVDIATYAFNQYPNVVPVSAFPLAFGEASLARIGIDRGFRLLDRESLQSYFLNPVYPEGTYSYDSTSNPLDAEAYTAERDLSAYAQARLEWRDFELIGGVRLNNVRVRAAYHSSPYASDEDGVYIPEVAEQFEELVEQDATQTTLLPRVLLNYRPTSDLVFRAGYFSTVARPQIRLLSATQIVSLSLRPNNGPNGNQPILTIRRGNPDLAPSVSHNFDVGGEYYFGNIGVLKANLFYKRITNLLENNSVQGVSALDGVILPNHPIFNDLPENLFVQRTEPVNNPDAAKIWGFELNAERQLTFLPGLLSGLGVYLNYTFTESSKNQPSTWSYAPVFDENGEIVGRDVLNILYRDVAFNQQPRHSGTVGVTYVKHGFDAGLYYTQQSRRRTAFLGYNLHDYVEPKSTLDLRVEYDADLPFGTLRLFAEGLDLLKGRSDPQLETAVGGAGDTPKYYTGASFFGGRSFVLGASLNL